MSKGDFILHKILLNGNKEYMNQTVDSVSLYELDEGNS